MHYFTSLTAIIQRKKCQTKHRNLDATNAYPQLDTGTRRYARLIQLQISLINKLQASGKRGKLTWIVDAVLLCKALFCFG